ncbi:hypothetical protein PIB30_060911 [Stylosanthes scabra]|uniref:Putative plant transposon protein domain-containing protein n=1 Tax=Stylosanthes scabra TaxID=79078 RepID=A0ABU6ZJD8_9FABA|nr:hypothetical protein [Stylosanthes scabra]
MALPMVNFSVVVTDPMNHDGTDGRGELRPTLTKIEDFRGVPNTKNRIGGGIKQEITDSVNSGNVKGAPAAARLHGDGNEVRRRQCSSCTAAVAPLPTMASISSAIPSLLFEHGSNYLHRGRSSINGGVGWIERRFCGRWWRSLLLPPSISLSFRHSLSFSASASSTHAQRGDSASLIKGWYDFVCRSIMPTTTRSELTVERAVLIHSIIIGENINVEEIIAEQFYKFIYKTDLSSSLPFPSIIAALCLDAKVVPYKDDTMIPEETPIAGEAMVRTRETRPRQPRQEVPPPQQPPQVHQQHELPPNFYTHFDASMSQIYRRLDQQEEENRKSFEAINTRMDRMDD